MPSAGRRCPPTRWDGTLEFFGSQRPGVADGVELPVRHRAPPRPDHDLPAADGIDRAADLRTERRRAVNKTRQGLRERLALAQRLPPFLLGRGRPACADPDCSVFDIQQPISAMEERSKPARDSVSLEKGLISMVVGLVVAVLVIMGIAPVLQRFYPAPELNPLRVSASLPLASLLLLLAAYALASFVGGLASSLTSGGTKPWPAVGTGLVLMIAGTFGVMSGAQPLWFGQRAFSCARSRIWATWSLGNRRDSRRRDPTAAAARRARQPDARDRRAGRRLAHLRRPRTQAQRPDRAGLAPASRS